MNPSAPAPDRSAARINGSTAVPKLAISSSFRQPDRMKWVTPARPNSSSPEGR